LLGDSTEAYVRQVLDELIGVGAVAVETGEYPTVAITEHGREVMWRREDVRLTWPEVPEKAAPKQKEARELVPEPGPAATELMAELRAWRMKTAKARRVPAYVVCGDRTLKHIAAVRPQDLAQLEAVHGMGPVKMAQYGDAILEIVDRHLLPEGNRE
jgi:ATP-dependent DNA helicase RecQ